MTIAAAGLHLTDSTAAAPRSRSSNNSLVRVPPEAQALAACIEEAASALRGHAPLAKPVRRERLSRSESPSRRRGG